MTPCSTPVPTLRTTVRPRHEADESGVPGSPPVFRPVVKYTSSILQDRRRKCFRPKTARRPVNRRVAQVSPPVKGSRDRRTSSSFRRSRGPTHSRLGRPVRCDKAEATQSSRAASSVLRIAGIAPANRVARSSSIPASRVIAAERSPTMIRLYRAAIRASHN